MGEPTREATKVLRRTGCPEDRRILTAEEEREAERLAQTCKHAETYILGEIAKLDTRTTGSHRRMVKQRMEYALQVERDRLARLIADVGPITTRGTH